MDWDIKLNINGKIVYVWLDPNDNVELVYIPGIILKTPIQDVPEPWKTDILEMLVDLV